MTNTAIRSTVRFIANNRDFYLVDVGDLEVQEAQESRLRLQVLLFSMLQVAVAV